MSRIFKAGQLRLFKADTFKKYLLYALGEMLLIVLSLLLALQINNFKEEKKAGAKRDNHIKLLSTDLQNDIQQLSDAKIRFEKELRLIENYQIRLNAATTRPDTLLKIARYEFNPNMPPFVRYNRNTWETMHAMGDIGLLSSKILTAINRLLDLQQEQEYYQQPALVSHANLLEDYLSYYAIYTGLVQEGPLYEQAWKDVNFKDLTLKFNALLTIKMAALKNALSYYRRIEDNTGDVIRLLNHDK